jgi:uncharacterized membrane protein
MPRTKGAKVFIHEIHLVSNDNKSGKHQRLSLRAFSLSKLAFILLVLALSVTMANAEEESILQAKEGDVITYYYNVSNIGNVNLTNVKVTDDKVVPIYSL